MHSHHMTLGPLCLDQKDSLILHLENLATERIPSVARNVSDLKE